MIYKKKKKPQQDTQNRENAENSENLEMRIQWFPGHMAKTRRLMNELLPLVDVVVEILDARIPISSRNPEIEKIVGAKPRVVILNKCDSSDENINKSWCNYFTERGVTAIPTDCRSGKGLKNLTPAINEALKEQRARFEAKGMAGRPIRIMIVGIPNVGKSSFINRMAGARRTKVEDRPGVTRGKQWVKLENKMELLDMPGVLWPKFEDKRVGENLAFTGAIKDDIMDIEELSARLAIRLREQYPDLLAKRYSLDPEWISDKTGHDIVSEIGRKRGMLIAGGDVDKLRASTMLLDEFRGAKIGRISLERPRIISSDKAALKE